MTDDARRDEDVARALGGIPVPDYEPGFWDRLDARLEHEGAPGRRAEVSHIVVTPVLPPGDAPVPEPLELPRVVPLPARRTERRRSLAALAAAAAVVLAIVAVQLGTREPEGLQIAGEVEGGQEVGPADGTTTPDHSPEQDGAERGGDDDGPERTDEGATDEQPELGSDEAELSPTTTMTSRVFGSGTGPDLSTLAAPTSAEAAFVQWAVAIDAGDVDAAVALTGPRTVRYYEALGSTAEEFISSAGESWGVYADAKDRHVQPLELGKVDGDRVVGLVVDRPSTDDEDEDGRDYVGVPVVLGDDGWQVEPAAFDPAKDGRIEMISPAEGQGLEDLPKDGVIKVAAQPTGEYYLNLDFAQSTRIRASEAVDGAITWDPGGQKSSITHLLVVAHLDAGQVVMLAQTFETAPAPTAGTASRSAR